MRLVGIVSGEDNLRYVAELELASHTAGLLVDVVELLLARLIEPK